MAFQFTATVAPDTLAVTLGAEGWVQLGGGGGGAAPPTGMTTMVDSGPT